MVFCCLFVVLLAKLQKVSETQKFWGGKMAKGTKKTLWSGLVEEVPGNSHTQHTVVNGVMGGEELVLVAGAGIDMTHGNEEAGSLQVHVGIDVVKVIG
jgi:hypothetical protein